MEAKVTTMKALVEAIQDLSSGDDEAIAVLTHLLSTRKVLAERAGAASQVAKSFF